MKLIEFTNKGLYCPPAKVYIDPWKKVNYAMITHGHSDHARWGHKHYLCTHSSVPILRHRLGLEMNIQGVAYGEVLNINGVNFSFHPAGHITGSAMIRVEHKGEIWVVSGDYKIEDDGLAEAFEPVPCHHFITECTFGLPVYRWKPQQDIVDDINQWWHKNTGNNRPSLITAYSLGKAQRILSSIDPSIGPIYTHGAVYEMNKVYDKMGLSLPPHKHLKGSPKAGELSKALIIAPPGAIGSPWSKKIKNHSLGIASGWMAVRGNRRRRGGDRGFALSDHCDWPGLLTAIKESGAQHIYPTHGNTETFSKYLNEQGYIARPVKTEFTDNSLTDQADQT